MSRRDEFIDALKQKARTTKRAFDKECNEHLSKSAVAFDKALKKFEKERRNLHILVKSLIKDTYDSVGSGLETSDLFSAIKRYVGVETANTRLSILDAQLELQTAKWKDNKGVLDNFRYLKDKKATILKRLEQIFEFTDSTCPIQSHMDNCSWTVDHTHI